MKKVDERVGRILSEEEYEEIVHRHGGMPEDVFGVTPIRELFGCGNGSIIELGDYDVPRDAEYNAEFSHDTKQRKLSLFADLLLQMDAYAAEAAELEQTLGDRVRTGVIAPEADLFSEFLRQIWAEKNPEEFLRIFDDDYAYWASEMPVAEAEDTMSSLLETAID